MRYLSVIKEVRSLGFFPIIWNIPPATGRTDLCPGKVEYATYGSQKQRNHVTTLFNDSIQNLCLKERILFISIYDKLVDSYGNALSEFYIDNIHLSQKAIPLALDMIEKSLPGVNLGSLKYTNNGFFRIIIYGKRLLVFNILYFLYLLKKRFSSHKIDSLSKPS